MSKRICENVDQGFNESRQSTSRACPHVERPTNETKERRFVRFFLSKAKLSSVGTSFEANMVRVNEAFSFFLHGPAISPFARLKWKAQCLLSVCTAGNDTQCKHSQRGHSGELLIRRSTSCLWRTWLMWFKVHIPWFFYYHTAWFNLRWLFSCIK